MDFDFSSPKEHKFYDFVRPLSKAVTNFLYDFRPIGTENIPREGGFILAANHISLLDAITVTAASTRKMFFMAKSELFHNPLFSKVLENLGAFPVRRGTSDKRAVEFAERILNSNWVLGIFPQGKRTDEMTLKSVKSGVAYIAKKTGADVLPVSLRKEKRGLCRPILTLRFGEIIKNSDLGFEEEYNRRTIRNAAEKIMSEIIRLYNIKEETV